MNALSNVGNTESYELSLHIPYVHVPSFIYHVLCCIYCAF